MSETIPPADNPAPEEAPAPKPSKRCCNWHRVRVYLYSIILMMTMWMCGVLLVIRFHPERMVHALLAQLPYSSSTGDIYWLNRRTLVVEDLKIGDFFYARQLIVVASPFGLWRHHIAKVQVIGGQFMTGKFFAALEGQPAGSRSSGLDWVIGRLEIERGTVFLDNIIPHTSVPVGLGRRRPIVMTGLRLGQPDSSPEMSQPRTVEVGGVSITSPLDPLTPVFFFPLTQVTFTYDEIWRHHIREIEMIRPTIFLGEDLFTLIKEARTEDKPTADAGVEAPWIVNRFEVNFGRLAVNAFGQPIARLPFFFNTKVNDIRLDRLRDISTKSTVTIANLTTEYPDYKVKIENLHGQLYFSWPPTNKNANNVVNDIYIDEVSWNDIPVTKAYASVTFDESGMYGKLYGKCEGGDLSGNLEFYYTKGFTWNVDLFAQKVNLQPIAEKLAGKYINLTGGLNGKIAVKGQATDILDCTGSLELPDHGVLKIKSMTDLLNHIPQDMMKLKRDALTISVKAFETYPYDYGLLTVNYKPTGGQSTLRLDGPLGYRQFDIALHPFSPGSLVEQVKEDAIHTFKQGLPTMPGSE